VQDGAVAAHLARLCLPLHARGQDL
jgi:hypothetical protein